MSFAYHDSDRPNVYLRIPLHTKYHLWGAVNARHNITGMFLPWIS